MKPMFYLFMRVFFT